jgi:PAS domain S-box-containing protein
LSSAANAWLLEADMSNGQATLQRGEGGSLPGAAISREPPQASGQRPNETDPLFLDAPIGLAQFDRELRFVRLNNFLGEIIGIPAAAQVGRSLWDVVPALREALEPKLRRVLEAGELVEAEISGETCKQPGMIRTWRGKYYPLRNPGGDICGIGAVIEDITLQEQIEAQSRLFVERAPVGIAMFDNKMRYLSVSRRFIKNHRLDGETTETLIGRSHYDTLPHIPEHWRDMHRRVLAGETMSSEEDPFHQPNGRTDWVRWEMEPWRRADGTIGGALLFSEFITQRKQTEMALAASESLLRLSQQVGRIGSWDWDLGTNVSLWSDQQYRLFGMEPEGGQPLSVAAWRAMVHPDDHAPIEQRLRRLIIDGGHDESEYRILRPDGMRWIFTRAHAIRNSQGKTERLIGVDIDITERRATEDELRDLTRNLETRVQEAVAAHEVAQQRLGQAEKMQSVGQLTGGIAHDFNNLLTVIIGTIDMLAEGVANNPNLAKIVKSIGDAAERGMHLTASLLAFARKQPLRPREVDVRALIAEVHQLVEPTIGRQIEVDCRLQDNVGSVLVDPIQLSSALVNLAINARDAMPGGGKLVLDATAVTLGESEAIDREVEPGHFVVITIADTGVGIPQSIQARIFEPFFSTKDIGKGTGLGLSIVYGFIKQSRGHIEFSSEEGLGTTFRIYLPAVASPTPSPTEFPRSPQCAAGSETILCVEDDVMVRNYVTVQLQGLGYKTIAASNAREALAILDSGVDVDLLFTDIVMPGAMDGWQLAEQAALRRPGLKILFTSGYSNSNALPARSNLLVKPYRSTEIARMLRLALDGKLTPTVR